MTACHRAPVIDRASGVLVFVITGSNTRHAQPPPLYE